MVKINVDEAYAIDYYSILFLKNSNGFLSLEVLQTTKKALQNKFFNTDLSEIKIGYESIK